MKMEYHSTMERTIRITGTGKVSVKPDRIVCDIKLSGLDSDYEKAVKRSADESEQVRESIASAGLDSKEVKTSSFDVDTEYSYYKDKKKGIETKVLDGYRYHHFMSIEFPNDNKILGKVLFALSHCPVELVFSIGYTVSDTESVKNHLLEKATADSRRKAEILAGAAGVKLGQILQIDYSWGEMKISTGFGEMRNYAKSVSVEGGYDIDFNAGDIDIEDTVTIVWEIESL